MMDKYRMVLGSALAVFLVFFTLALPLPAEAENNSYGLSESKKEVEGLQEGDPRTIAGNIIGAVLAFVGVIFFVLVIYGGLLWMTARGNEQQIEKAKNLIGAAIVGLIIILSAYAITSFVGTVLTE